MNLLSEGARRLGLALSPRCLKGFQTYYEELIAWNERFNLTAITDYEQVQVRHFTSEPEQAFRVCLSKSCTHSSI